MYSNSVVATASVFFSYDPDFLRQTTVGNYTASWTNLTSYTYKPFTMTITNGMVSGGTLGAGRVATVDGPLPNDLISFGHDPLGRATNYTLGSVVSLFTFDGLNRLSGSSNALGTFSTVYTNNSFRPMATFYPNSQRTEFDFDTATNSFRLKEMRHLVGSSTAVSRHTYTYSTDDLIEGWEQQADSATPKLWEFKHDPVGQLLSATRKQGGSVVQALSWVYDEAGNRLSETSRTGVGVATVSGGAFNALNQLTQRGAGATDSRWTGSINESGTVTVAGVPAVMSAGTNFTARIALPAGTNTIPVVASDYSNNKSTNRYELVVSGDGEAQTLTYDLNGNLATLTTATRTNSYTWDAVDRLVALTNWSGGGYIASQFEYDAMGHRVRETELTNGVIAADRRLVWSGNAIAEERDAAGTTVTKRFFSQGEQVGGNSYYYTRDHLGSVREVLDGSGTLQARYDYDPYGRRSVVSGTFQATFGYTGHYWNAASGLHFAMYRTYDPSNGRWLSRDPIKENRGLNLYGYVGNNPINAIDPKGLTAGGAGIGGVIGIIGGGYIGGSIGGLFGIVGGGLFGTAIEPIGGTLVGAIGGGVSGAEIGVISGATAGAAVGAWLGDWVSDMSSAAYLTQCESRSGAGSSIPTKGQPGSCTASDNGDGTGTIRDFGPDGKAGTDYDFGHDHTGVGDPHAHDWDWSGPKPPRMPLFPGE